MAQLKSTTVTGDLTVSGHVINNTAPTANGHLVNKSYVDNIIGVNQYHYGIVANNVTGENRWNRFTSDSYDVTLGAGQYLVVYSCTVSAAGTGVIATRMTNNGTEIATMNYANRSSAACNSTMLTTVNCSFVLDVDETTSYQFYPQVYGSSTWVGRGAMVNVIKLTP